MDEIEKNIVTVLDELLLVKKFQSLLPLEQYEKEGIVQTIKQAIEKDEEINNDEKEYTVYKEKNRIYLLNLKNSVKERDKILFCLIRRLAKEFNVEPQMK